MNKTAVNLDDAIQAWMTASEVGGWEAVWFSFWFIFNFSFSFPVIFSF